MCYFLSFCHRLACRRRLSVSAAPPSDGAPGRPTTRPPGDRVGNDRPPSERATRHVKYLLLRISADGRRETTTNDHPHEARSLLFLRRRSSRRLKNSITIPACTHPRPSEQTHARSPACLPACPATPAARPAWPPEQSETRPKPTIPSGLTASADRRLPRPRRSQPSLCLPSPPPRLRAWSRRPFRLPARRPAPRPAAAGAAGCAGSAIFATTRRATSSRATPTVRRTRLCPRHGTTRRP